MAETYMNIEGYCKQNPQIKKLVALIKFRCTDVRVKVTPMDIAENLRIEPVIQSEGGIFVEQCMEQAEKIKGWIFWAGMFLGFYPGITKLIMEIHIMAKL